MPDPISLHPIIEAIDDTTEEIGEIDDADPDRKATALNGLAEIRASVVSLCTSLQAPGLDQFLFEIGTEESD